MIASGFTFIVLLVLFSAFSRSLGRWNVTAPIAFVVAGGIIGLSAGTPTVEAVSWVRFVAELALVLILFHDAAQVRPRELAGEWGLAARMLGIAFPLTLIAGFALYRLLFPDQPLMLALLVAACLAATDAGLGAATVLNPVVPIRVRRLLNVESGLNDGLAAPVALFAITALAGTYASGPVAGLGDAVVKLSLGVAIGTGVGVAGAVLLGRSRARGWSTSEARALAVLGLPLLAYGACGLLQGNGFVAAYVAGLAFAGSAGWLAEESSALHLSEVFTAPLGFAVWGLFGLVAIPRLLGTAGWREVLLALLSVTVLRMLPVALALAGTGLRARTVLFVGWFGPRGLVSLVFALIAYETLPLDDGLRTAATVVGLTVVLCVLAHGLSAEPLARRYGAWVTATDPPVETAAGPTGTPRPRGTALRSAPVSPPHTSRR